MNGVCEWNSHDVKNCTISFWVYIQFSHHIFHKMFLYGLHFTIRNNNITECFAHVKGYFCENFNVV